MAGPMTVTIDLDMYERVLKLAGIYNALKANGDIPAVVRCRKCGTPTRPAVLAEPCEIHLAEADRRERLGQSEEDEKADRGTPALRSEELSPSLQRGIGG